MNKPLSFLAASFAVASLGFALLTHPGPAGADDDHKSDVRALRAAGTILPMENILALSRAAQPGQVMEVELDREDGRYVYEVKIIDATDRVHKLELDAASGAVLKHKSR